MKKKPSTTRPENDAARMGRHSGNVPCHICGVPRGYKHILEQHIEAMVEKHEDYTPQGVAL